MKNYDEIINGARVSPVGCGLEARLFGLEEFVEYVSLQMRPPQAA